MHALKSVARAMPAAVVAVSCLSVAGAQTTAPATAALAASTVAASNPGQAPATPPSPKWYDKVKVGGYMQLDAIFPDGDAQSTAGHISNFRIRRARPTITAQIDPRTTIQVQFDVSTGIGSSTAARQNAFVIATFADHLFSPYCDLRFGQMLLPFGREVFEDNAAIRSPLELSYAGNAIALGEFDTGIMVASHLPEESRVGYGFGFFNGQGLSTADANANKTFIGRLGVDVSPVVHLAVNGMVGKYKDTTKAAGPNYDRDVLGGEVVIRTSKALSLSGEIYNALFVNNPSAPTETARFTGGYLLLESWIGPLKSIPFLRYQRTYGDLDYRSFDLGWRYQFETNQRLTFEYDIVRKVDANMAGVRWQINF